jgi:iron complex transport system substrate-binding protein
MSPHADPSSRWPDQLAASATIALIASVFVIAARPPQVRDTPSSAGTVVEDMRHRRVRLDVPVQRVMFDQPVVWHYMTVDATDAHVATLYPYLWKDARNELLGKLFPGFARHEPLVIRAETNMLSIEQLMIEDSDAVITGKWFGQVLETVGYPGVVELDDSEEIEDATLFRLLGAMAGKPERAEGLLRRYHRAADSVRAGVPRDAEPVDVMVVSGVELSFADGRSKTIAAMLRDVGGRNAAQEDVTPGDGPANIEELYRLEPQVILIRTSDADPLVPQTLYDNGALRALDAVRQRRVYRMPSGASLLTGPVERPLMLSWMARLLHPEGHWESSLREEIAATYREVYGYAFTERDFETMLRPGDNAASAGFDRVWRGETAHGSAVP